MPGHFKNEKREIPEVIDGNPTGWIKQVIGLVGINEEGKKHVMALTGQRENFSPIEASVRWIDADRTMSLTTEQKNANIGLPNKKKSEDLLFATLNELLKKLDVIHVTTKPELDLKKQKPAKE